jgi:hypothetical protein
MAFVQMSPEEYMTRFGTEYADSQYAPVPAAVSADTTVEDEKDVKPSLPSGLPRASYEPSYRPMLWYENPNVVFMCLVAIVAIVAITAMVIHSNKK